MAEDVSVAGLALTAQPDPSVFGGPAKPIPSDLPPPLPAGSLVGAAPFPLQGLFENVHLRAWSEFIFVLEMVGTDCGLEFLSCSDRLTVTVSVPMVEHLSHHIRVVSSWTSCMSSASDLSRE